MTTADPNDFLSPYEQPDTVDLWTTADEDDIDEETYYGEQEMGACTSPGGHSWIYTGTIYGGDDERWSGEGRCYCRHCGADGDS